MSTIQVFNPTAQPIGPIHYGDRELVFQPDPDKNPKQYTWELAPKTAPLDDLGNPTHSIKDWQAMVRANKAPGYTRGGRFKEIDDAPKLASNIVELPADFKVWFDATGSVKRDVPGAEKLIFGKELVNNIKAELTALKAEKAAIEAESQRKIDELREQYENEKKAMERELAASRAEVKVANTRVVK